MCIQKCLLSKPRFLWKAIHYNSTAFCQDQNKNFTFPESFDSHFEITSLLFLIYFIFCFEFVLVLNSCDSIRLVLSRFLITYSITDQLRYDKEALTENKWVLMFFFQTFERYNTLIHRRGINVMCLLESVIKLGVGKFQFAVLFIPKEHCMVLLVWIIHGNYDITVFYLQLQLFLLQLYQWWSPLKKITWTKDILKLVMDWLVSFYELEAPQQGLMA